MLSIGTVARRGGVRPSTIRYYEAQGILTPSGRLPNGYRIYDDKAVASLRLIRRAQGLGISLAEVKEILTLVGRGETPCRCVKELARNHLRKVEQRIRELQLLQRQLQAMLQQEPRQSFADQLCPLLGDEAEPLT
jgi:DNA-binding transcriptional MerR regulator